MENLIQYILLILGTCFFVWGTLIVGSDTFFKHWQDSYWQEKNKMHATKNHVFYNRYVTGLSTLCLGVAIVYLVFMNF